VTGSFLTKPETGACFRIYENLLGPPHDREVTFDLPSFHNRHHDLSHLEEDFSQEEIWATIRDLPLDKAPGLDEFTGRFYKSGWNFNEGDIKAAILAIQQGFHFKFRLLNTAFITLLPRLMQHK